MLGEVETDFTRGIVLFTLTLKLASIVMEIGRVTCILAQYCAAGSEAESKQNSL